jgi:hypothetical protein
MNAVRTHWITGGAIAVLLAVLVTACGGGGGSSGASASGTGKTTHVTGVIAGFGSVIVNGVHFESDSAAVTLEGQPGTVGDLKVGEVVHLEATTDGQGRMHATTIDQERLIQGVVQAVDAGADTLTVEGQLIMVDDGTSFDDSIPGRSLTGIVVGDRVEVHGFVGSGGEAHATRIEMADAADAEIEVTGPISALDSAAMRFNVGTQVVDYSTATLRGFPASGLAAGDMVEVKGTTLLGDGALKATRVSLEDGGLDGHAGDGAELEGLVTRFVSDTDFNVSGHKVTTTGTTAFVGGTSADLVLDAMVEVEGMLDGDGTLVAAKVVFRHESTVRLAAPVEAVDAAGGTVQLLGVTVMVTLDTRREDNETDDHYFSLDDVHVGDWVEVSAYPDPAGSSKLVATRLERDGPENLVELRGPAVDLAAPTFSIAGLTIETTPETTFEVGDAQVGAGDFFALAVGQVVEVRGTWNGTSLIASLAEVTAPAGDHTE